MTSSGCFKLFVYGTLRSNFRNPAYEYIARYFNLVGEATAQGKLFDLGEYPGAVPSNDGSLIRGELYTIKNEREFAWAICQLDDYEGSLTEPHETPLYLREITLIRIDGTDIPAWIYWYNGDTQGKPLISSGDIQIHEQSK